MTHTHMCQYTRWLKRGLQYSFSVYETVAVPPTPLDEKFIPSSRFLMIKTACVRENPIVCLCFRTSCLSWRHEDPSPMQESRAAPETTAFVVSLFLRTIQTEIMDSSQHRCDVLHMWNSPTFSREWLCTEELAGYFGLRGPQIRRKDSSQHLSPHSSDGLN